MSQALQPGSRISHYLILGPLGSGGMGEVYRAKDESLGRDVALKILPPEAVRSEERVRRFILEAKSASSLSHPNIVTIHEIGHDLVRAEAGSEMGSAPVHFIAMELVAGETLAAKIHHEKTDLRALLGYLAQAAEGLAKTHAAGIIHRDLKPGNIMVTQDGFAKVLDFGLAKLTERSVGENELTATLTQREAKTGEGVVLGTTGYMSPEQVQGKPVDHRSDIFSFGSILYEAATRRNPFEAETGAERMAKILREKPAPIEELNPQAPADLRKLIRRCLAKDPNQRLDSMRTLALELREIVEEYESLSASATSSSGAAASLPAPARRWWVIPVVVTGAMALTLVGVLVGAWLLRPARSGGTNNVFQTMQITTVTSRGDVSDAVLSPDGRYLAYSSGPPERRSLYVRQLATETEVQILPPQNTSPGGLQYSPDGTYLYYLALDPETSGRTVLYQISSLGGKPRRRASEVDSRVTFSPDGKRICFGRNIPQKKQDALIILDLQTGRERTLATAELPQQFSGEPSWSPDGKQIAVVESTGGSSPLGRRTRVVTVRVEDGRREKIGSDPWDSIYSLAWLPDATGLLLSAQNLTTASGSDINQVWLLPYPGGGARRITNDSNNYEALSLSSDGRTFSAVRPAWILNIWVAEPAVGGGVRQLTFGSTPENAVSIAAWARDGSMVFMSGSDRRVLRRIGSDGSGERPILSGGRFGTSFYCLPDGGIIFSNFGFGEDLGVGHVWRADADGGNARQLASRPDGEFAMDVSPDGRTILIRPRDHPNELWTVAAEGGEAMRVTDQTERFGPASFSPDGNRILYSSTEEEGGDSRLVWKVIRVSGGDPIATLVLPSQAQDVEWSPDGESLTFLDQANGVWNVYRQRLSGGNAEPVTRFPEGQITDHEWSPEGRSLGLARRTEHENVWVTAADGSHPTQLTDFKTGRVIGVEWMPHEGRRLVFSYGQQSSDVVLIRNFR